MIDAEFFSSFSGGYKRISFSDPLSWSLSPSAGHCCFMTHFELELKKKSLEFASYLTQFLGNWKSLSRIWLFATPWTIQSMEFSRPEHWNGFPSPPPGDLHNQWSNPVFPQNPGFPPRKSRQVFYHLSHQRSPKILEWVAYSFSRGSSLPRNWGLLHCR